MSDRKRKRSTGSTQDRSSTRGGAPRRGGFGDDQGTRIGSPTPTPRPSEPPDREYRGPSSTPVKEGLKGAIFDENDDQRPRPRPRPERPDTERPDTT